MPRNVVGDRPEHSAPDSTLAVCSHHDEVRLVSLRRRHNRIPWHSLDDPHFYPRNTSVAEARCHLGKVLFRARLLRDHDGLGDLNADLPVSPEFVSGGVV